MKVAILGFGIVKEIFGSSHIELEIPPAMKVNQLQAILIDKFPGLSKLTSFMIAVNNVYAREELELESSDEIAIIPPVSGG